ncbi:hypothetical protein OQA88_1703 [Cercophora sp. LCS_1]
MNPTNQRHPLPQMRYALGALPIPNAPVNHPSAPAMPIPSIASGLRSKNAIPLPPLKSVVNLPAPSAAPLPPAAAPLPTTSFSAINASNKRKSTDTLEDDDDKYTVSYDDVPNNITCTGMRRKIEAFLETGEMNKTNFCKAIGVNSKSFYSFMSSTGERASGNSTLDAAWVFFKQREVDARRAKKQKTAEVKAIKAAEVKAQKDAAKAETKVAAVASAPTTSTTPASKPAAATKTKSVKVVKPASGTNSAGVDISDIHLEGEETDTVPIYDTCDEIRRKINAHLQKPGVTQAQFCRDICGQFFGPGKPSNIQGTQIARFRSMMGAYSGNSSLAYYGAYVFFEKIRIKQGTPKTKTRENLEKQYAEDGGIDRSRGPAYLGKTEDGAGSVSELRVNTSEVEIGDGSIYEGGTETVGNTEETETDGLATDVSEGNTETDVPMEGRDPVGRGGTVGGMRVRSVVDGMGGGNTLTEVVTGGGGGRRVVDGIGLEMVVPMTSVVLKGLQAHPTTVVVALLILVVKE